MSLYHRIASTAVGHAAPARRPARALVCATRSTVRVRASSSQKATTATQTNSAVDVRSTRVARALAAPPKGVAAAARIRRFRAVRQPLWEAGDGRARPLLMPLCAWQRTTRPIAGADLASTGAADSPVAPAGLAAGAAV
jgi:hypothetical protein